MAIAERETDLDRLRFLIETQRLINAGSTDADRVASVVLDRAQVATSADGASLEILQDDVIVSQSSRGRVVRGFVESSPSALSNQCARLAIPLICRDTEADPRVERETCRAAGVRSMAVAPLVHCGQGIGVLKVVSGEPDHFVDADADMLELTANFVVSALTTSDTFERDAERALRDPLTGLPSRAILMDRMARGVYEAARYGRQFGLFFIDLDHFSAVNESLGYEWGDVVLRAVAVALSDTVRAGDTLARAESDHFVIMTENADESVVEDRLKGRIRSVLSAVNSDLALLGFELTATIAVVWSRGHDETAESLLAQAGEAVRRLKRARDS